jgi:pimeloyl-ACP methyl ester carboxylesterase
MKRRLLKWGLWMLVALAALYLAASAYLWATQRQRAFVPVAALQSDPSRIGLRYEAVHRPVGQGSERGELYGWWLPAGVKNAPALLFLHGNAKNIGYGYNLDLAARLHSMGFNVLVVDYRGYGKSSGGEPDENKMYEDAEAAWQYMLTSRAMPPQRSFIYGHSLGSAVAIDLATRHPEAAGLITESAFTSMDAMAQRLYSFMPVELLLNQHFDSLDKIEKVQVPVLLIHGAADTYVPPEMSQQLYERAHSPKQLKLIAGGEHTYSASVGWIEYRDVVTAFVKKYAR